MLPQKQPLPLMQTSWAQQLNPLISNLLISGHILNDIPIMNGVTQVNHLLGRKLVGWLIIGVNGAATVYDTQATNPTPQLTLSLTSNAAVTVSLWVF